MITRLLKLLAYTLFFLLMTLVFVRQTLPLETVKEKLIAAAAQRGFELEVATVEFEGIFGLQATELSLRRSPTTEEQAALKSWREARRARREAKEAAGVGEGARSGGRGASKGRGSGRRKATESPEDPRPPMPKPIRLSTLSLRPEPLTYLLSGKLNGEIEFSVSGEQGHLLASAQYRIGERLLHAEAEWEGLNFKRLGPLTELIPAELKGSAQGSVKVDLSFTARGRPRYRTLFGELNLRLSQLQLSSLMVQGAPFKLNDFKLGTAGGRVTLDRGRAEFIDFSLGNDELSGALTGQLLLAQKKLNLHIGGQISAEASERVSAVRQLATIFRRVFKRQPDKSYRIGLLLKGPMNRPRQLYRERSPFAAGARARSKRSETREAKPAPRGGASSKQGARVKPTRMKAPSSSSSSARRFGAKPSRPRGARFGESIRRNARKRARRRPSLNRRGKGGGAEEDDASGDGDDEEEEEDEEDEEDDDEEEGDEEDEEGNSEGEDEEEDDRRDGEEDDEEGEVDEEEGAGF